MRGWLIGGDSDDGVVVQVTRRLAFDRPVDLKLVDLPCVETFHQGQVSGLQPGQLLVGAGLVRAAQLVDDSET